MMRIEIQLMKYTAVVSLLISGMWLSKPTVADSRIFGIGSDQFNMEFVAILQANNADDATGAPNPAGSVAYNYSMGKFEVSRDMVLKANSAGNLGITLDNMSSLGGNGVDRPATGISWNEAARFVNWLNTSTGGFAAYKTPSGANNNIALWTSSDTLDYDVNNPYRSRRANYVLPSMDEWYKAAFYNPITGQYFNFPNVIDSAPVPVASGTAPNTAVYSQPLTQGPADIMSAGGLSPYGIMGMGGNVFEFEETAFSLNNNDASNVRGLRGGYWFNNPGDLSSSARLNVAPEDGDTNIGFRVASLTVMPEPSSCVLTLIGISGLLFRRRMRK